jgi:hydrogenase nickel incorporation protein HypA/HybF
MHEAHLIDDLIRKVESVAHSRGADKVVSVRIKVGALSHISGEHLREHFARSTIGTIVEEAQLEVETLNDISDPQAQEIRIVSLEIE